MRVERSEELAGGTRVGTLRGRRPEARHVALRGLHLVALSALALAQPLFDILSRYPEFFAVRGSTGRDIVLFAALLTLGPPALLVTLELVAGLVAPSVGHATHLFFVGSLTSLLFLQVLERAEALQGPVVIALALALGTAAAAAYAHSRIVRSLLSAAGVAPVMFAGLFLLTAPIAKLVFPEDVELRSAHVDARTPVVLIVFDELSTVSLMDRSQHVDGGRYPNFAALARDSIWCRNATSVHPHTEAAVPAILTGNLPREHLLPILADHPRNLFTLLGGSYRMNVVEPVTHLCPRELCRSQAAGMPQTGDDAATLLSDTAIVYGHLVLPKPYSERLPPISDAWTNFGGLEQCAGETPACARQIFAAGLRSGPTPSLNFLHTLLPHVTWQYLPSGRRYGGDIRRIPGIVDARWTEDEWLTVLAYQRYLLQLGYTDRALGIILRRLKATGLYDRSLVVITADHGVSFKPGQPRRLVSAQNLDEIAFVPLFVKLPRAHSGRVVDSAARTIDIVPTIADVLDVRLPWRVDGRSLLRTPRRGPVTVVIRSHGVVAEEPLSALVRQRLADLHRQIALFGAGGFDRIYHVGPNRELLGADVSRLDVFRARDASVDVPGASLLADVDPDADPLPAYLTGRVEGVDAGTRLAIALNGSIVAVTRTYKAGGEKRFAAIVPPAALRKGRNDVAVFAIRRGGERPLLADLGGGIRSFRLIGRRADERIVSSDGETARIVAGAVPGTARFRELGDTIFIGGWAVDPRRRRPADTIAVFVSRTSVFSGLANYNRREALLQYGIHDAGFYFEVPRSLIGGNLRAVRVFALADRVASELPLRRR